jgi:hypothetical protein
MKRVFMVAAGAGFCALFWKELPALTRYLKIERM